MKILTLWLWAFGFAVNKLLWENNKSLKNEIYAYEKNKQIRNNISKKQEHPFFFSWYKISKDINIIDSIDDVLWEIDLLILAMPAQFISSSIKNLKWKLKKWVVILNLAKWIDILENKTISFIIKGSLWEFDYNYSVLSWWMIASELVEWKMLWADLAIEDFEKWKKIKKILENKDFEIVLRKDILNVEIYGSLKNIAAIVSWYYEWKWFNYSTIAFYLLKFYNELREIVILYWWNKKIDFSYFSLWWDLIATCFWDSRNRYFWRLLWEWKSLKKALEILKNENKHSEWYETLKAIWKTIKDKDWFEITRFFYYLIKGDE